MRQEASKQITSIQYWKIGTNSDKKRNKIILANALYKMYYFYQHFIMKNFIFPSTFHLFFLYYDACSILNNKKP